jgi:hypothetical protein
MKKTGLLAALVSLAFPLMAHADGTACTGAIYMSPNGSQRAGSFSSSTEKRWYTFEARPGRSYVVAVENMSPTDVQTGVVFVDFQSDCTGLSLPAGSILRSAAGSGTVEIVHDGPPDAIVASTTVLSPTTGLSFDAPFVKRVTR